MELVIFLAIASLIGFLLRVTKHIYDKKPQVAVKLDPVVKDKSKNPCSEIKIEPHENALRHYAAVVVGSSIESNNWFLNKRRHTLIHKNKELPPTKIECAKNLVNNEWVGDCPICEIGEKVKKDHPEYETIVKAFDYENIFYLYTLYYSMNKYSVYSSFVWANCDKKETGFDMFIDEEHFNNLLNSIKSRKNHSNTWFVTFLQYSAKFNFHKKCQLDNPEQYLIKQMANYKKIIGKIKNAEPDLKNIKTNSKTKEEIIGLLLKQDIDYHSIINEYNKKLGDYWLSPRCPDLQSAEPASPKRTCKKCKGEIKSQDPDAQFCSESCLRESHKSVSDKCKCPHCGSIKVIYTKIGSTFDCGFKASKNKIVSGCTTRPNCKCEPINPILGCICGAESTLVDPYYYHTAGDWAKA